MRTEFKLILTIVSIIGLSAYLIGLFGYNNESKLFLLIGTIGFFATAVIDFRKKSDK